MINSGLKPYFWMLCGCFWFSLMALSANAVGPTCDWPLVAFARSLLATIFATLLACFLGVPLTFLGTPTLWLRSIAGSFSMLSTFYALTHLPPSEVLTITNTFPIWVALLSWPLLGERPSWSVWLAVASSVVGVGIVQQPSPTGGLPLAAWSALAASAFTAIAMLGLNRLRNIPSLAVVVHFSAVSTLFCIPAYLLMESPRPLSTLAEPSVWLRLLAVGLFATIGQVFLTLAFKGGQATKVAVVGLSQVVMVLVMEWLLGRPFGWLSVLGTVLVLGPTGWIMLRERRPVPDAKPEESVPEEVAIE